MFRTKLLWETACKCSCFTELRTPINLVANHIVLSATANTLHAVNYTNVGLSGLWVVYLPKASVLKPAGLGWRDSAGALVCPHNPEPLFPSHSCVYTSHAPSKYTQESLGYKYHFFKQNGAVLDGRICELRNLLIFLDSDSLIRTELTTNKHTATQSLAMFRIACIK